MRDPNLCFGSYSVEIIITFCVNLLRFALSFYVLGNVTFCGPIQPPLNGIAIREAGKCFRGCTLQARIQVLAKGEVVKIMENSVLLPQAANVSDSMPRKRVTQPSRMIFSGYTIDSGCTSWEPIGSV